MDAVNLAEYLFKNLRKREQNTVDIIAGGNVRSMEDYKYLMGELSAIRSLIEDLKETLQMEDNDE
jgi:hypothetical protein|tara:strand:+ start:509 stop:703 length:195 start_codon:yes stop_codon:yes gene_type:complete